MSANEQAPAYIATAPAGMTPALLVRPDASPEVARWHHDYDWTHGTGVEGFFLVVTLVTVPFAAVRWLQRFRVLGRFATRWRGRARS
jgi:hypothetical protein